MMREVAQEVSAEEAEEKTEECASGDDMTQCNQQIQERQTSASSPFFTSAFPKENSLLFFKKQSRTH